MSFLFSEFETKTKEKCLEVSGIIAIFAGIKNSHSKQLAYEEKVQLRFYI